MAAANQNSKRLFNLGRLLVSALVFLFPVTAPAQGFNYVAEEVRSAILDIENLHATLEAKELRIRETVTIEPWETNSEYHKRLEEAILGGTTVERSALKKSFKVIIPPKHVRVRAGEYQRNERWWSISVRTKLAGLLPEDEELEVRFFHDISVSKDVQKDYYYFDNLLLTDALGAEISYTVFLSDDFQVYIGKVSGISLVDLSTGKIIETQEISWIPVQRFTVEAPVIEGEESQIGGLTLGTRGPGGGYIFWDKRYYADGWRYLEAAPEDLGGFVRWGVRGLLVENTSTEIGTGAVNTAAIVSRTGKINHAARMCQDLDIDGVDDWFLPSREELDLMYVQKDYIKGLSGDMYWSSSEYNETGAWYQNFSDGNQLIEVKDFHIRVRAIRAF